MPASPMRRSMPWPWRRRPSSPATEVTPQQVLAIGDGVHTDIAGATSFGVDSVFVVSGLHVDGGADRAAPLDGRKLAELFKGGKPPLAAMRGLVW